MRITRSGTPEGTDEDDRTWALVKAARNVLEMFQSGHHPTFTQLERLENALEPWTVYLTCGHVVADDCSCEESHV